jgi:hypothetical protein
MALKVVEAGAIVGKGTAVGRNRRAIVEKRCGKVLSRCSIVGTRWSIVERRT